MFVSDLRLLRPFAPALDSSRCFRHLRLFRCPYSLAVPARPSLRRYIFSSEIARVDDACDEEALSRCQQFDSRALGIRSNMIPRPTRKVLDGLKRRGYEVYLVGGCVRDLILKRTPKDFDIITSAKLNEVVKAFSFCLIVGKRFPICHVHMDNDVVEVSSFTSFGKRLNGEPPESDKKEYLLMRDSKRRDFTINSLFFDPYEKMIYDYVRGIEDIKKGKVKTVSPAADSFSEDSARILRAIRIAGRLGFRLSRETAYSIKDLSSSVLRIDKGRLLLELNYMLAYGSSEPSLRLLWRYGVLDILLPMQAAYFVRCGFKRRDRGSNMLLSLFSNLDKLLAPNKPCHSILWVGLLAFHKALFSKPRHPLVVAVLSLAMNNGGNMVEALKISKTISRPHFSGFTEILQEEWDSDLQTLREEVVDLANSVKEALSDMSNEYFVSRALSGYPGAPSSNLVFITLALSSRVDEMFQCVTRGSKYGSTATKQGKRIDHKLLAQGNLPEVRHTFARVVFDTIYPLDLRAVR